MNFYSSTESTTEVKLSDILIFFTGADREPPLGFSLTPTLKFLPNDLKLATASTCTLVLNLPISHTSYDIFKSYMTLSFLGHGGIHCV